MDAALQGLFPPGTDLCTIPAVPGPDGQVPNFINPPTLTPTIIAVGVISSILAVIFVWGRLYANRNALTLADYFMISSLMFALSSTGVTTSHNQFNRHQWDIPLCWVDEVYLKKVFAQTLLNGAALCFSKASIFFMFLQTFSVSPAMRKAIYFGLFYTFSLYFTFLPLSCYFLAPHPGHQWAELFTDDGSQRLIPWGVAQAALSILLHFYIFILPIPMISRIRLPYKKRLQIIGIFATALLAVVASTVGLVYRIRVLEQLPNLSTWEGAIVCICLIVEYNVAIIVGCMPGFAKFYNVHVSQSCVFKWLGWSNGMSSAHDAEPKLHHPQILTFGSPSPNNQAPYVQVTDTMLLESQISSSGTVVLDGDGNKEGIYRSVHIMQHI